MKKSSLLKMKNLPATEEMLAVAREDVPVKVGSGWNTSYRCRYSGFVRSAVEGGILKVTLYDPDAMRLGGTLPVYEIFMEKEKQQFLTYDRAHDKWRTAKIDYLEWQAKGSNNVWISAVDDAQIRQYLVSDEKNVYRAIEASNDGCTLAAAYPYNPFLRKISPKKSAAMQSTAGS